MLIAVISADADWLPHTVYKMKQLLDLKLSMRGWRRYVASPTDYYPVPAPLPAMHNTRGWAKQELTHCAYIKV